MKWPHTIFSLTRLCIPVSIALLCMAIAEPIRARGLIVIHDLYRVSPERLPVIKHTVPVFKTPTKALHTRTPVLASSIRPTHQRWLRYSLQVYSLLCQPCDLHMTLPSSPTS